MKISLLLFLLSFTIAVYAQDSLLLEYSGGITSDELKTIVKTLASDKFEGRDTGEKGQKMAAEYIRQQFINMGLKGPSTSGDPYYQEFSLARKGWQSITIINGRDSLLYDRDLMISGDCNEIAQETELIFMGYGIDSPSYSDYSDNISVNDKLVVFLAGEPKDKNGRYIVSGSYLPEYDDRGMSKAEIAIKKGALGAIRINPDDQQVDKLINMNKRFRSGMGLGLLDENNNHNQSNGLIHIGISNASKLFGIKQTEFNRIVKKLEHGKYQSGKLTTKAYVSLTGKDARVETENVVGFLKGSEIPDELIIITAHYDHLGMHNGDIFNGADDNASGTAVLIEVAEAYMEMAESGIFPKRSILFMPVTGEEKGLLGSKYYVKNPIFPLKQTVAEINMDMVGRSDKKHTDNHDYVYVYMSDTLNSDMDKLIKDSSSLFESLIDPEYRYKNENDLRMGGSDHASFENIGIPVYYFFCGIHEDYHRPTDTWEKVEYDKMSVIAKMVFTTSWMLANQ